MMGKQTDNRSRDLDRYTAQIRVQF